MKPSGWVIEFQRNTCLGKEKKTGAHVQSATWKIFGDDLEDITIDGAVSGKTHNMSRAPKGSKTRNTRSRAAGVDVTSQEGKLAQLRR